VFSLSLSSTFNSKTVMSSNTSLFTASASYSSTVASYNIKVNQLAQAHSLELAPSVHKDAQNSMHRYFENQRRQPAPAVTIAHYRR
jgi:flagellar capping protein FliD